MSVSTYQKSLGHRGFTLIELVVALALLALLVSAATPMVQINAKRQKEQELRKVLWQMRDAIDAYKLAVEDGLIKKDQNGNGYPPTLRTLVVGVENLQDPDKKRLFFLRRIPRDPFADDPEISNEETWMVRAYDGTQGEFATDVYDISSRSTQLGINQQPYNTW
jgi:general secretion pathway protein G